mgnify:CR=1 FL=1
MKNKIAIIISIISLILGIVSCFLFNTIISLLLLSCFSAIITYKFYTKNSTLPEIVENNLTAISFVLTFILLTVVMFSLTMFLKENVHFNTKKTTDNIPVELVAISNYDDLNTDLSFQTFTTKRNDTSVILVKNNSEVTFRNSTFEKKGGTSSNCEYSSTFGLNSVYLNNTSTTSHIYASNIISEESCSIPLFVYGENSIVEINDSKIESKSSNNSSAITTREKASIKANNITVLSKGKNSPALNTGEDTKINIVNSLLETSSHNSPIIDNSGITSLKNITGTSNQDRFLLLKKGELSLEESTILVSGRGDSLEDHSAIKIIGDSKLSIKDSSININNNGLYYNVSSMMIIEKASTEINLENSILNTGNNTFLKATDSKININLTKENIVGDIINNNSDITLNLINSNYKGNLNNTILYLDENSTITLTKNTTLKELHNKKQDNSNIILNGYELKIEQ